MSYAQLALPGLLFDPADDWVYADDWNTEDTVETFQHATVMRDELVAGVLAGGDDADTPRGGAIVDATLGGAGHAEAILEADPHVRLIGIDRDEDARNAARVRLERFGDRVTIVHAAFSDLRAVLTDLKIPSVRGVCADLGVSSPQLDRAERGMSFRHDGPIDMRMDRSQGETALDMIARLEDDELADVLFKFGDERRSRRIARSVKKACDEGELVTTLDLRRAVVRAVGPVRVGGVDPATRTFQALRIAVNGELSELDALLAALPGVLRVGGVASIISFHSLEDRAVKLTFVRNETWIPLHKKPMTPSDEECVINARARSAKLRSARFVGGSA